MNSEDVAEATEALEATVGALSERYPPTFNDDLDGMMFDHPIRIEGYDDPPTIRNLK
jgi:hypothetical protein